MRLKQYRIRLHFQSNKGVEPPSLRGFLVLKLSTGMTDFESCLAGVDDRAQPGRRQPDDVVGVALAAAICATAMRAQLS